MFKKSSNLDLDIEHGQGFTAGTGLDIHSTANCQYAKSQRIRYIAICIMCILSALAVPAMIVLLLSSSAAPRTSSTFAANLDAHADKSSQLVKRYFGGSDWKRCDTQQSHRKNKQDLAEQGVKSDLVPDSASTATKPPTAAAAVTIDQQQQSPPSSNSTLSAAQLQQQSPKPAAPNPQESGQLTFYDPSTGGGACTGKIYSSTDMVVALSSSLLNKNIPNLSLCGKRIDIAYNDQKSEKVAHVVATVVDECSEKDGCVKGTVDGTVGGVWKALGLHTDLGKVAITWRVLQ